MSSRQRERVQDRLNSGQPQQSPIEELLTLDETAQLLKVRKSWLHNRCYLGRLPFPFLKVGNFTRFRRSDIQKYLMDQTRMPGTRTGNVVNISRSRSTK